MSDLLTFSNRTEFREWLKKNAANIGGVWLLFGKKDGPTTLTAKEALEEALCYGWIDGQMKSLDNTTYKKYFARRTKNSKWSEKNKKLAEDLENRGIMTEFGREKIEEAKKNGRWNASEKIDVSDEQISSLANLLQEYKLAYKNFQAMSPSVKKTYTRAYFDAKTESGRNSRLSWIIKRLNENLKPM